MLIPKGKNTDVENLHRLINLTEKGLMLGPEYDLRVPAEFTVVEEEGKFLAPVAHIIWEDLVRFVPLLPADGVTGRGLAGNSWECSGRGPSRYSRICPIYQKEFLKMRV